MYTVKRGSKYLCSFTFRDGYDYRSKNELSQFSEIVTGNRQEMSLLANQFHGKVAIYS